MPWPTAPGARSSRGWPMGQCVGKLAAELPVTRSAVSQHLKMLKDAGLVSERGGRNAADLPAQPGRGCRIARPARHLLEPRARRIHRHRCCELPRHRTRRVHDQNRCCVVRQQIVVQAPIDRAFAVFTERFGDFKPPEHNLLAAPIAETVFEPTVGGNIFDRAVDGSECRWARILAYDPPQPGRVQLGHRPAVADRDRPGPDQRGRGPVLRRNPGHAPGWSSSTATSTGTVPAGKPSSTVSTATRVAALPGPLRGPVHPGSLTWRRSPRPSRSTGQPPRCSSTPPTPPDSASGSKASSTGAWTTPAHPRSATCASPPDASVAPTAQPPPELTHIDPPRAWGVRGTDGPIRATVDVTVEPLNETRSRLTISVDFDGHGIGRSSFRSWSGVKHSGKCPPTSRCSSNASKHPTVETCSATAGTPTSSSRAGRRNLDRRCVASPARAGRR